MTENTNIRKIGQSNQNSDKMVEIWQNNKKYQYGPFYYTSCRQSKLEEKLAHLSKVFPEHEFIAKT